MYRAKGDFGTGYSSLAHLQQQQETFLRSWAKNTAAV
jgi:predicted signal transduction protein with EAL and GGDEF domain